MTDLLAKKLVEPSASPYGAPAHFEEKDIGHLSGYWAFNNLRTTILCPALILPVTNWLVHNTSLVLMQHVDFTKSY